MTNLCQDIVLSIVFRLPVKLILRFRCVSKNWCKLLKDPGFVKKHLNHAIEMNKFSLMIHPEGDFHKNTYTLAYDHSSSTLSNCVDISYPRGGYFWGACNGLICLTTTCESYMVFLWNPATKEFKELPVPIRSEDRFSYTYHGFGYDNKIDDFKVISFLVFQEEPHCEVHLYTLKSNSWRKLETIPYDTYPDQLDIAQVSVNGAMHWLAKTGSDTRKLIVSFDFKDDRFNMMPLPSFLAEYGLCGTNLCSLGGSLCLHGSTRCDGIDVWEMKEYGVTDSWTKLFSINQETICRFSELVPLLLVMNGEVLLGYDIDIGFHLDLYDLKRGNSINLKAHANRIEYAATTFVYVESLVTLNSGTYVELPEIEDPKANARKIDLDSLTSSAHGGGVDGGDSEDDDDSEEEEEEEEEIAEGLPTSPKSVDESTETK